MKPAPVRFRASQRPEDTKHWGALCIATERRAPFKAAQPKERPALYWWPL
ncbi:hypothetical protein [Sphingomonas sp. ABOLE]|nr:hypothetical protein [Sphingomonas sp. ABOLE]